MPQKGQTSVTLKKDIVEDVRAAIKNIEPEPTTVSAFVTVAIKEKLASIGGKKQDE